MRGHNFDITNEGVHIVRIAITRLHLSCKLGMYYSVYVKDNTHLRIDVGKREMSDGLNGGETD